VNFCRILHIIGVSVTPVLKQHFLNKCLLFITVLSGHSGI